ncbi:ribonuclease P protein component [Candidatus Peregrinibacteria bacterium]|nr:ribonuclease P protein component [Candidatus Peregrinibacteria bacterium]
MIAKKYRVPREKIAFILRKGEERASEFFIIRLSANVESFSRFRTIVSRKMDRSAVKRNSLRRKIYEAIRLNVKENDTRTGKDIILIPKKKILNKSFLAIKKDIKKTIWTN